MFCWQAFSERSIVHGYFKPTTNRGPGVCTSLLRYHILNGHKGCDNYFQCFFQIVCLYLSPQPVLKIWDTYFKTQLRLERHFCH